MTILLTTGLQPAQVLKTLMAVVLRKIAIYCSVAFHVLTYSMEHSLS